MLRQTLEDLGAEVATDDPFIQNLPSSRPDAMRQEARRLLQMAQARPGRSRLPLPRWWPIAAAFAFVAVTGAIFLFRPAADHVDALLAQAYTEARPSELRFPGARFGPVRHERGEAPARSASMMEAEVAISKALSRHPTDARWLQLRGRAALLDWRYDEAIDSLNQVRTLAPDSLAVLADLAAAYFERAQGHDDSADYRVALDLLSTAIERDPKASELRFNRAVVLGSLSLNARAVEEWTTFLQLEPNGAWAVEARMRLASIRVRMP
jgi:tetratricopeptide (TPR) repeat protein